MKQHTDWNDEEELFNDITNALQEAGINADARDEQGSYRERGTITIRTEDGRSFALEIWELS